MKISRTRRRSVLALGAALALWGAMGLTALGTDRVPKSFEEQLLWGPGLSNHPVHVIPSNSVRLPADWPLDPDGSIACVTCHETLPALDGSSDPYLRDQDPFLEETDAFCLKCHSVDAERTVAGMHWMAVERAHYREEDFRDGVPEIGRNVHRSPGLDIVSGECLGCHDGVTAGNSANPTTVGDNDSGVMDRCRDHPVGIPYPRGLRTEGGSPFRSEYLLPAQVRLPEGKVSCVSCHDLYSRHPSELTVAIENSALCLTCHDM